MRTNPAVDINTDWQLNGIVKPRHVNALTRSIKYDYVITAQMLEGKTGTVDVDELLGGNKINGTTGVVHVLINTMVRDNVELYFPANSVGGPTGTLKVHVHTIGPFTASVGTSGIPYIEHYFHTHGPAEAVTFTSLPLKMHVGAFIMDEPMELMDGASFIYEMALAELPFLDDQHPGTVAREAWMSNAIGGGGGDDSGRLVIGDYSPVDNYSIGHFVIPGTVTDDGLSSDKPIDMSKIREIKWMPGSIAFHTLDGSESLALKGTIRPYPAPVSGRFVYHGGGSNCRAILIEGAFNGGINDFCVSGGVTGKISANLSDPEFTTTTDGSFTNATLLYNGTTYTGESGSWSSDGTVSGTMGGGGYSYIPIKSISLSTPISIGGIQSSTPIISGSFGGGTGSQIAIKFDFNGYEATLTGEISGGGFSTTMPKMPSIACSFASGGDFSYSKDASGVTSTLDTTISSGGTSSHAFYLPVLYLNTATMVEDRLYSILIEYMHIPSNDGELALDRSLEYDAITIPASAGIWDDCDLDTPNPIPSDDYTTTALSSYTGATCRVSVSADHQRWEFGTPGGTLCFMPIGMGYLNPADTMNLMTWNAGGWAYDASDGSLTATLTKTIDDTLYTIKIFIIGSHHESHVITSAAYFKLFAIKPSENTNPITKRNIDDYEHRDVIQPRMFALDDVSGIPACDNYHVPQWVGEVYLMKRNGVLYAWGP